MKQHNCKEELREVDLRATPTRLAVMKYLETTNQPVDAGMILNYLGKKEIKTDPATVFRIVNVLTQKGITIPIQFQEGKARYELANKKHHYHLVCQNCSRIEEISDTVIPNLEKEIQKKHNFLVKRNSLEFFGLCHSCQK
jgi:Fur family transcriptional regulator, ferric uptake regulator